MSPTETIEVSREELAVLIKNAGLTPTEQQFEEMYEAYGYVGAMLGRLKRDFSFTDEPAHVFTALTFADPAFIAMNGGKS